MSIVVLPVDTKPQLYTHDIAPTVLSCMMSGNSESTNATGSGERTSSDQSDHGSKDAPPQSEQDQFHDCDPENWHFGPVILSGSFDFKKKKKDDDHLYPTKFDSPEHYARTIAEWAQRHFHRPNPRMRKTQRSGIESPTQIESYIVTIHQDLDIANIENTGIPPGLCDLTIPSNRDTGGDHDSSISTSCSTYALAEENFEIELAILQSQLESITWEKQADDPAYTPKVSIMVIEEPEDGSNSDPGNGGGTRKAVVVTNDKRIGVEQRILVLRLDVITLSLEDELWSL